MKKLTIFLIFVMALTACNNSPLKTTSIETTDILEEITTTKNYNVIVATDEYNELLKTIEPIIIGSYQHEIELLKSIVEIEEHKRYLITDERYNSLEKLKKEYKKFYTEDFIETILPAFTESDNGSLIYTGINKLFYFSDSNPEWTFDREPIPSNGEILYKDDNTILINLAFSNLFCGECDIYEMGFAQENGEWKINNYPLFSAIFR